MPTNPAASWPVRVILGEEITVDFHGADGSLRVRGKLESAPERYTGRTGDIATRLVITDARAQILS